jgi:uncharacterized membrane protein
LLRILVSKILQNRLNGENQLFLWHPIIVHFAIALLSIAIITDLIYLITKKENLKDISTYLFVLGTLSAIAAVLTGHQAEEAVVKTPQVETLISSHENSGEITMWIFIVLTASRFFYLKFKLFEKPVKWFYYVIGIIAFSFLLRTGILGGEMVYIHGVGISDKTEKPIQKPSFKE